MPSPFPGMNPYIEQPAVWQDFHTRFMVLAAELIGVQVEPRYFVKVEEHLFVHELTANERRHFGRPDLTLVQGAEATTTAVATDPSTTAPATVFVPDGVDEVPQRFLEIRDRQTRQVVTVLELLSPSNKDPNGDREQYWKKIRLLLSRTEVGIVEIDLLRGGLQLSWKEMPDCDYYALASRAATRPKAEFWPIQLRETLPTISIPLREGESKPTLNLQAMIHRIYDAGQYRLFIYDSDPEPPLSATDAAWAAQVLSPGS
jgi:hypothetical protein